jgi:hypothetical protein
MVVTVPSITAYGLNQGHLLPLHPKLPSHQKFITLTKYLFMSRHQTAGQSNYIRVANKSFERVAKCKYLGSTLTDQNCIRKEIRSRLNSGNACYHAVQNLLSSRLLSRNVKIKIYKTIILRVVLYGCETWSVTLRKEHRLRVFENRALRRIFGPKRDEVTGSWRKLHNEELHGSYSSPSTVTVIKARRMRLAGHVARMGEVRVAYNILVGRPEGRRPLGPRRRLEDNIKMDLREIGFGDVDFIHLAQDRDMWQALVNTVMNLRRIF